jgi:hypothetical protein
MVTFRPITLVFCLCAYVACSNPAMSQEREQLQFRPLFNGKDLSGWVLVNTPPQTWTVADEMLICSGKPVGELRTDRMYQNFILEIEWRHMVPGGNAGIFVWADDITARGVPFHRSVEVQVLDHGYGQSPGHTTHGDIFPIHGAKMTPENGRGGDRAFPTEERSKPSPEWNHYRIECQDGAISLAVNGKVVTRGKDASPRKGYICLESEGGIVHYRNIRVHELPDTPVSDEHVATSNRDFRSIYTGLDLSGWKVSPNGQSAWAARDWVLAFDGTAEKDDSRIETEEEFGDIGFIIDLRPSEDFQSLTLRRSDAATGLVIDPEDARWSKFFSKRGQWLRCEGQLQDGKLTLHVDGERVIDKEPIEFTKGSPSAGSLSLQPAGPVEFANLYIRNLP